MTSRLRALVRRCVGFVPRSLWALWYPVQLVFRPLNTVYVGAEYEDRTEAFKVIYKENRWRNAESKSGLGSTLEYTRPLRRDLERFLEARGVASILDAPCGDFNWMKHVRLPAGCRYLGRDIVPELIRDLKAEHPGQDFDVLDIVHDPVPKADVWICRDVLFHLPLEECLDVLRNFVNSEVEYILIKTFDFPRVNTSVKPGGFRFLNMRRAPFNLPTPLQRLVDFTPPYPPAYVDVWSRAQVAAALGMTPGPRPSPSGPGSR